jgi:hypothetical protein
MGGRKRSSGAMRRAGGIGNGGIFVAHVRHYSREYGVGQRRFGGGEGAGFGNPGKPRTWA